MKIYIRYPNFNKWFLLAPDGTEFELNTKDEMINLRDRLLYYFNGDSLYELMECINNFGYIKAIPF